MMTVRSFIYSYTNKYFFINPTIRRADGKTDREIPLLFIIQYTSDSELCFQIVFEFSANWLPACLTIWEMSPAQA